MSRVALHTDAKNSMQQSAERGGLDARLTDIVCTTLLGWLAAKHVRFQDVYRQTDRTDGGICVIEE